MWAWISSLPSIVALVSRILDLIDGFKRWMFIQEKTKQFDDAAAKAKATGDPKALEDLLRDPNRSDP